MKLADKYWKIDNYHFSLILRFNLMQDKFYTIIYY